MESRNYLMQQEVTYRYVKLRNYHLQLYVTCLESRNCLMQLDVTYMKLRNYFIELQVTLFSEELHHAATGYITE